MADSAWHTKGNWRPVLDEIQSTELKVQGHIPENLNGTYIRTGPNPGHEAPPHWFLGDGMVHGIRLREGRAEWYRNAFVQTKALTDPKPRGERDPGDLSYGTGNTSIHMHNGKILALLESAWPWRIDQDLNTLGIENFGGELNCAMTAHPKICPITGELFAFSYFQFAPPYLRYIRIGADGAVEAIEPIDIPNMAMMHDFAITRNYAVFMDLPLLFDFDLLPTGMPFGFKREAGARLGILPRNGTNADMRWFDIDPCYVFHTVNAHEDGTKIHLIASRARSTMEAKSSDYSEVSMLWRWTVDLKTGDVSETQLDDRPGDFGRINDAYLGLPAQHGYLMELGGDGSSSAPVYGNHLLKYDLASASHKAHALGPSVRGGEPMFVQTGQGEDEGYVMAIVHDEASDVSSFILVDAQNFDNEPVAKIELPQRVPYGAHGNWIPLSA